MFLFQVKAFARKTGKTVLRNAVTLHDWHAGIISLCTRLLACLSCVFFNEPVMITTPSVIVLSINYKPLSCSNKERGIESFVPESNTRPVVSGTCLSLLKLLSVVCSFVINKTVVFPTSCFLGVCAPARVRGRDNHQRTECRFLPVFK